MKTNHILISGGTDGIGKATAMQLASQGSHVVIIGRSEQKSHETVSDIRKQTGNQQVDYLIADLSSLAETVAVADAYKQKYQRLDVLINNVGAIFFSRGVTVDGIENTFALNHLSGYFLLTQQLLDIIKASTPARIVNVSSDAHYSGKMPWDDLELQNDYSGIKAYAQSKLANVLFTYELARRLEGSGVTTYALHPGVVGSNFGATNNNKRHIRLGQKVFKFFGTSLQKGAQTSVYLASSADVETVTGKYFAISRIKASSEASYIEADQVRLWEESERYLAAYGTEDRVRASVIKQTLPASARAVSLSA